jgi:hypothetical protein
VDDVAHGRCQGAPIEVVHVVNGRAQLLRHVGCDVLVRPAHEVVDERLLRVGVTVAGQVLEHRLVLPERALADRLLDENGHLLLSDVAAPNGVMKTRHLGHCLCY